MAVKKVRKIDHPTPQAGLQGKVTEIRYDHGVKLGLGHNTYSSIDLNLGLSVSVDKTDDLGALIEMTTNRIHREIAQMSEERKQAWLLELGVKET